MPVIAPENIRADVAPEPIDVVCQVRVSAEAAERAVAMWLIAHVHMVICGNSPRLQVIGDARFWEVPLTVNLPTHPPSAPFYTIRVDALTGALLVAPDEAEVIRAKATPVIYEVDPPSGKRWEEIQRRRMERERKQAQEQP